MHWHTWTLAGATGAVWLAVNLVASPGSGPRRPPKAPGSELERAFGWPATYRAELWESDDPRTADSYAGPAWLSDPSPQMTLVVQRIGLRAAAVDLLLGLVIVVITCVASEGSRRRELRRSDVAVLVACVSILVVAYLASGLVSVFL
jgi:hypothetical protein